MTRSARTVWCDPDPELRHRWLTQVRAQQHHDTCGRAFSSTYVGGAGFHAALRYYLGENNTGAATSNDGQGAPACALATALVRSAWFATGTTKFSTGNITTTNFGG